jgi:hypothetical protein
MSAYKLGVLRGLFRRARSRFGPGDGSIRFEVFHDTPSYSRTFGLIDLDVEMRGVVHSAQLK